MIDLRAELQIRENAARRIEGWDEEKNFWLELNVAVARHLPQIYKPEFILTEIWGSGCWYLRTKLYLNHHIKYSVWLPTLAFKIAEEFRVWETQWKDQYQICPYTIEPYHGSMNGSMFIGFYAFFHQRKVEPKCRKSVKTLRKSGAVSKAWEKTRPKTTSLIGAGHKTKAYGSLLKQPHRRRTGKPYSS